MPPPGGGGRCCWVIRIDAIWGVCRWYKSEEEMKEKKQEGGADLKVRYAPQVAFESLIICKERLSSFNDNTLGLLVVYY